MKQIFAASVAKRLTLLALCVAVLGPVETPLVAASASKQALLENTVSTVIVPGYQAMVEQSRTLVDAAKALAAEPTQSTLDKAQSAWRQTMLAARRMQWLESGPIAERESLSAFYYGRVMTFRIDKLLKNTDPAGFPKIENIPVTARGMFALEYLLFEPKPENLEQAVSPRPASVEYWSANRGAIGAHLVAVLAEDVYRKALAVQSDWTRTEPQGAPAVYANRGQDSLNILVNELAWRIEELAENRLNIMIHLPAPIMRQLDRIEGARSDSALNQLIEIVEGTEMAYLGGDGIGVHDSVHKLNPELAVRVAKQFKAAHASLTTIHPPFELALINNNDKVAAAYTAVRDLEILLKVDVASTLGVTITINSNDGD